MSGPTTPYSAPETGRSHFTERIIGAPPEAVYAAFSDPARLARWWGPKGFSSTFEAFDLRAGGGWRFTMHGPDGTDYPNTSVFRDLVPNARVVIEHLCNHHFVLTITFDAVEHGTRVGWRQVFDTVEHYEGIAAMVSRANEENLDRLTAEVIEARHGG